MIARHAVSHSRLPEGVLAVCALALSVGLHALWLVPDVVIPKSSAEKGDASITVFSGEGTGIWSPILFALPSQQGFSGAVNRSGVGTLPPLQASRALVEPLDLQPSALEPLPFSRLSTDVLKGGPLPAPDTAPPGPERSGMPQWTLTLMGLESPKVRLYRMPSVSAEWAPLVVEGELAFSPHGGLSSLLLDPPGPPPEVREEILLSLRRVRADDPEAGRRHRFHFSFAPDQP